MTGRPSRRTALSRAGSRSRSRSSGRTSTSRPAAGGLGEQAHAAFKAMDLTVLDIPADAAMQLASLGARTGCRMPDCSVVRAAARTGGAVLTFDEKLRGSAADLGISGC
jgi:hypothetical protein